MSTLVVDQDRELAVGFAGVLNQAVGKVFEANLVFAGVGGIVFGENYYRVAGMIPPESRPKK